MRPTLFSKPSHTKPESKSSNLLLSVLTDVITFGDYLNSRIGPVYELRDISVSWPTGLYYTRPKMNQWIGWTELLQLVSGTFQHLTYELVAPNAKLELFTPEMAYGPRITGQWASVVAELSNHPDSRRAIMYVGQHDEPIEDRPCTVSIQFLVRDGLLHTYVTMRSWDVYKGMPYDIMMFSGLSLFTAKLLNLRPGFTHVSAASAHTYVEDLEGLKLDSDRWHSHEMTLGPTAAFSTVEDVKSWARITEVVMSVSDPSERLSMFGSRGLSTHRVIAEPLVDLNTLSF